MNPEPLVIVTRIGEEGRRLCDRVLAQGGAVLHLPLLRLEGPSDPDQTGAALRSMLPVDGLIVTSREGLRQLARLLEPTELEGIPLVVPGGGTASLAEELGLGPVFAPTGAGDSEAMLRLPCLRKVAAQRWLILAAPDGRRLLDQALADRGARVLRADVYQRVPVALESSQARCIDDATQLVTLVASGSALERLRESLGPARWDRLRQSPMVLPSRRLLDRARALGCTRALLSHGADDASMLEALASCPTES